MTDKENEFSKELLQLLTNYDMVYKIEEII